MKSIGALPLEKSKLRKEWGLRNTLLVGGAGTAKTSIVIMYSRNFNAAEMSFKRINFSSSTEPINF
jgi:MoxR-like ATPase